MPTEVTTAERARWLAELGEALEEAQRLTWNIGLFESGSAEAMELYGRMEAARLEAQSIQLGGFKAARLQQGPDWTELLSWSRDKEG